MPQTAAHNAKPHKYLQNMQTNTHKTWDSRQLGAKMNGKTRDFYDAHPRFIEKTRHSHKRLSKNTVKIALKYQLDSGTACHKL